MCCVRSKCTTHVIAIGLCGTGPQYREHRYQLQTWTQLQTSNEKWLIKHNATAPKNIIDWPACSASLVLFVLNY